ncbi:MAG: hypothetical protein WBM24_10385 [Candidatus Sulfotelmatobacter sp.]
MFRSVSFSPRLKTLVLGAALFVYPGASFAQHGGGGGHIGGSAAGSGGLSSGNRASGIENKDDLRDFHEIMAVQASNEQKAAYATMVKSTAAAGAQLQDFVALLGKENNASEIAKRDKSFADSIETALTLNKKFLEGFSEPQKSGLKEITKRLGKADSELAQTARSLDQQVEANATSAQMAGMARSVEGALAGFQREQADLGDEMSISNSNGSSDVAFNIPTVKNKINFAGQAFSVTTSGTISKAVAEAGQNTFAMELTADMSDLQQTITDVLHAKLDTSDRCGERIALQTAALTPQEPASLVVAQLHYERWTCATMFGRESMNEIVEGSGTIEVKLTPAVAEDGGLRLSAKIDRIDAEGLIGDSLRSDVLGNALRDKISDAVLSTLQQGADFKAALPAATRSYATLQRAKFQGVGSGKLLAVFDGDIRVSNENLPSVTRELQERSLQSAEERPELTAR